MNFRVRLKHLQEKIEKFSCDAIIIDDAINLSYLTGIELSAGFLIVHSDGAQLYVDGRYYELCQKLSPCPVILATQMKIADVLKSQKLGIIKKLGFNSETVVYNSYQEMQKQLKDTVELIPLENPLKNFRSLKDPEEIKILKEAAQLGSKGYDFVCSLLKENITEIDVARELEIFWKQRGSKSLAFEPIIAFGINGSMPHYRARETKLKPNISVLIDIGVNYRGYHSDMTRVVFFGKPQYEIKKIYEIVLEAQLAALDNCRPGTSIGALDEVARKIIRNHGYGEQFNHSLGHGVGLEIHEYPILRNKPPYSDVKLEVGMVITIEPGIYLPGVGGVRIEDTVVITDSGHENLTDRSKELKILT